MSYEGSTTTSSGTPTAAGTPRSGCTPPPRSKPPGTANGVVLPAGFARTRQHLRLTERMALVSPLPESKELTSTIKIYFSRTTKPRDLTSATAPNRRGSACPSKLGSPRSARMRWRRATCRSSRRGEGFSRTDGRPSIDHPVQHPPKSRDDRVNRRCSLRHARRKRLRWSGNSSARPTARRRRRPNGRFSPPELCRPRPQLRASRPVLEEERMIHGKV